MRSLAFFACALVVSSVLRGFAAPTADEVRRTIAERCAKVDHFSMVCPGCATAEGSGSWGTQVEYRFDRPMRRLAVGAAMCGVGLSPVLLIEDRRAFFLLDGGDTKPSLYLKIEREHAITWKDITGALHLMRNECEPYGFVSCCSYEKTLSEISTWFLAPFLGGGLDSFFSQRIQPLHWDAKLFASDPAKAARQLMETEKLTEPECGIYVVGHPDSPFMASPFEKRPPLALDRFPICFRMKTKSSSLVYAFNRESGVFSAVLGTVDTEEMFHYPGNKVDVLVKALVVPENFEDLPRFELSKSAKIIEVAELKSAYRQILAEIGLEETLKQKTDHEKQVRELIQQESHLSGKLAKLSASPKPDRKTLEDLRSQLALTRGKKETYAYLIAKAEKMVAAIRQLRASRPQVSVR